MNKAEFLSELRDRLRRLPNEEIENAINYYDEYFNEAGGQNEYKIIMDLGSPSVVASKIIGEYAITDAEVKKKNKSGTNSLLIVILAVCASPIALPFAIALIIIVFSLFMVYFAFFISGIGIIAGGVASAASGAWALFSSFPTGIFYIGAGLVLISMGAAINIASAKLSKSTFYGLQKALGKLLIRSGVK